VLVAAPNPKWLGFALLLVPPVPVPGAQGVPGVLSKPTRGYQHLQEQEKAGGSAPLVDTGTKSQRVG